MKTLDQETAFATRSEGPDAAGGEQRIGTVVGDRLCVKCSFNLVGQLILREPVYGLLIVRCPECATVAALQEYPSLGKWAGRLGSMLAGLWLLVLIALIFGAAGPMFGLSLLANEAGSEPYADAITEAHETWSKTQAQAQTSSTGFPFGASWNQIDSDWWIAQDHAAMLRAGGGAPRAMLSAAQVWAPAFLFFAGLGVASAVALMHLRRFGLLLVGLVAPALASCLAAAAFASMYADANQWLTARNVAQVSLAPLLLTGGIVVGGAGLLVGLMVGRPIARAVVKALLPPRMRNSLSRLWLCDGLEPIGPRRKP